VVQHAAAMSLNERSGDALMTSTNKTEHKQSTDALPAPDDIKLPRVVIAGLPGEEQRRGG
jgi:hypothetical protein